MKRSFGLPGAWDEMALMGFVGSTSSNIGLKVECSGDGVTTYNARLAALKVNRLIGTNAPERLVRPAGVWRRRGGMRRYRLMAAIPASS